LTVFTILLIFFSVISSGHRFYPGDKFIYAIY
jgi:hypothetical protein